LCLSCFSPGKYQFPRSFLWKTSSFAHKEVNPRSSYWPEVVKNFTFRPACFLRSFLFVGTCFKLQNLGRRIFSQWFSPNSTPAGVSLTLAKAPTFRFTSPLSRPSAPELKEKGFVWFTVSFEWADFFQPRVSGFMNPFPNILTAAPPPFQLFLECDVSPLIAFLVSPESLFSYTAAFPFSLPFLFSIAASLICLLLRAVPLMPLEYSSLPPFYVFFFFLLRPLSRFSCPVRNTLLVCSGACR